MKKFEPKLAKVLTENCGLEKHRHCSLCGKKMCFYNREGGYWVCFGEGICEDCYAFWLTYKDKKQ